MNKRKNLKAMKAALFGLGLGILSMNVTGCSAEQNVVEENLTDDMLKEIDDMYEEGQIGLGIIKEGDQYFPICIKNITYRFIDRNLDLFKGYTGNVYNLDTKEYIGKMNNHTYGNLTFYTIDKDGKMLYLLNFQLVVADPHDSNVTITIEMAKSLDDTSYKDLEEMNKCWIPGKCLKKYIVNRYDINSLELIETKEIVGLKISETEIYNFETFQIENYENWNIYEGTFLDENEREEKYSYNEVLDYATSIQNHGRYIGL